ncbi:putative acetyltransferase EpsM [bioreactor metagenome]|uniref:Putative acetyltransferase EpsM n=1 Tax=bioreactor metagenome TaxID=1076179 RepID=A0A645CCK4_9ZZZZ
MGNLLIIGAGGHGMVVAEAAELEGRWDSISFLDDRQDIDRVLDYKIIGTLNDYEEFIGKYEYVIVAIGNNEKRLQLIEELKAAGYKIPIIIHPRAWVSSYSNIGEGSVILAGAVVNTNSNVGKGCIININSCIDHDSIIEDGVHVCSSAIVRSMCKIGRLSYIGAGSCVTSGLIIKEKFSLQDGIVAN